MPTATITRNERVAPERLPETREATGWSTYTSALR